MKIDRIIHGLEQRYLKVKWNFQNNNIFFLMFHEVPNVVDNTLNERAFAITQDRFEQMLMTLAEKECQFASINDALHHDCNKLCVVITFDDVYESVVTNAIPILNGMHIPFTLFISESLIDQSGFIASDDIKKLSENPLCEIGFHSKSHLGVRSHKSREEIIEHASADALEDMIHRKCRYYAYPYGSVHMCPKKARDVLAGLEYEAAFGTVSSGTSQSQIRKNRFYIPRINVNEDNAVDVVKMVSGR